jgi:hypothetical protein
MAISPGKVRLVEFLWTPNDRAYATKPGTRFELAAPDQNFLIVAIY